MKDNHTTRPWITADEALSFLHEETGLIFTQQDLFEFHRSENLSIYLDCSFSPGCMDDYQYLAKRIKGAGYCKLLDAGDLSTLQERTVPSVKGPVIVQGMAWVYSLGSEEAQREEGIWRFDCGDQPRPLHFSRAEIHGLGRQIKLDHACQSSAPLSHPDTRYHPAETDNAAAPAPVLRAASWA